MPRRILRWTIAVSLALHGVAYASLGAAPPRAKAEHRKTQLRFDVVSRPEPKPAPPPAEPYPRPKPRAAPKRAAKPERAAPPPPGEPLPLVNAGVTLAADGTGNAFSMPLGDGGALDPTRAVPLPTSVPLPTKSVLAAVVRPVEPPLVAVGDLSTRPSPPSLGDALERNYPADARHRGLSGIAKVRARIDPDGVVRHVTLLEESANGFGMACTRALGGSRWAPPKDKSGRSVATEIRYTCRFVVAP